MRLIDLRSDTVTQPTQRMRAAMAAADVGDDVFGEDPTVNRLEAMTAEMFGKEGALFVPSGTQSNLLALLSHCERGDEYIAGQDAHCYRYEGGGAAVLGSIQPQPLEFEPDGTLDLARAARAIKPADHHFARTRLLCLEDTQGGKVLPLDYLARARAFALERKLAIHLDGARVFNAAVKQGVSVQEISGHFDSVSVCLSKGLGAPVGSLLCGSRTLLEKAHRWRKVLGGGMRQAGVLAAAGIVALTGHVERLADDHENARRLALGLADIKEVTVDLASVQTNMVFAGIARGSVGPLTDFLKGRGIMVLGQENMRLVTHLDVTAEDMDTVIAAFREFFA
jgi:threonine aldolase